MHRASRLHGLFMLHLLPPQEGPPGMWKDLRAPPPPPGKDTTESPRLVPAPLIHLDQPSLPPGGHCLSASPTLLSWDHSASETLSQGLTLQMAARSLEGGMRVPAGSRDSAHWARSPAVPPGHGQLCPTGQHIAPVWVPAPLSSLMWLPLGMATLGLCQQPPALA